MRPDLRLVDNRVSAMTVAAGIEHFLCRLQARGKAGNTLLAYRADLKHYVAFIARLGQGDLVAVQSARHVARFLDDQAAQGISPRSMARRLSTLRMFFRHARIEGWIGHDPTADERVTFRKPRVVAPELDQLHAAIDAIPRTGALNLRDRALLRLLLDAAPRISGLRLLDIPGVGSTSEIDLKRQVVYIIAKGGGSDTLPFNDATARIVEDWLRVRDEFTAPGCPALFTSQKGGRLSRNGLHRIIVKRGDAVGLHLHAHLLRHRRGAHVIEGCGAKVAQQFLGHASLQTTSDYGAHADPVAMALIRTRADIDAGRKTA